MKGKQVVGIVVACTMFILVGMSSYVTRQMVGGMAEDTSVKSMLSSLENAVVLPAEPFVGVVRVEGTIMDAGSSNVFDTVAYDHKATLDYINKMMNSDTNEGILLYVDSPGGTVYHSDELYLKLKEYKEQTGRPIWTYMANQACSGGYYVSMASDHIGINRNGWTGSIGVIVSLTNYSELYKKLGVEEIDITSGANKAMGSAGRPMKQEQRDIFQSIVDESYEQFVEIVSDGRTLPIEKTKKLADGRIYTAKQALENGLVDEVVTTYKEYEKEFRKEIGGGVIFYEPSFGTDNLFTSLFSKAQDLKSKSDAEVLSEVIDKKGSGVQCTMQRQENNIYYAGFFVRLAAWAFDGIIVALLLFVIKLPMLITTATATEGSMFKEILFQFTMWDILFYILAKGYYIVTTYCTGATFGKKLMNIKVVSAEGKLTLWNVLYRETIGKYLSDLLLCIGYIIVGFDREKRGFHDMLSDTRVIYNLKDMSGARIEMNQNTREIEPEAEEKQNSSTSLKSTQNSDLERYYRRSTDFETELHNNNSADSNKPQYKAASYGYDTQKKSEWQENLKKQDEESEESTVQKQEENSAFNENDSQIEEKDVPDNFNQND